MARLFVGVPFSFGVPPLGCLVYGDALHLLQRLNWSKWGAEANAATEGVVDEVLPENPYDSD